MRRGTAADGDDEGEIYPFILSDVDGKATVKEDGRINKQQNIRSSLLFVFGRYSELI